MINDDNVQVDAEVETPRTAAEMAGEAETAAGLPAQPEAEMPQGEPAVTADEVNVPEATKVAKTKKATSKAGKAVAGHKAKATDKAAKPDSKPEAKPQVSMFVLGNAYPALKVWPTEAGPRPTREQIITAAGLLGTKPADMLNSKRVLGVASYLRDGSLKYAVAPTVALALQAVCGGAFNDIRNACNRDIVAPGFCQLTTGKVDGKYKSYHLVLTPKGAARVNKYRDQHGLEGKHDAHSSEPVADQQAA